MTDRKPSWYLEDAEDRARVAPDTFFIPPRDVRHDLTAGDIVKLLFFIRNPEPGGLEAERMWVEVKSAAEGIYVGELLNAPSVIRDLKPGDRVVFEAKHVAAIAVSEAEVGYRVDDRVIISRRLAASSFRPGRLRRDEPTHENDSGWVALIGNEQPDDFHDASLWAATQLGFLADRFPELEAVFREGRPGDTWSWNDKIHEYEREED
jgi:hypothetical protein